MENQMDNAWKPSLVAGQESQFYEEDFRMFLARCRTGPADLIVTSPPYVGARTPGAYGLTAPWTPEDARELGDAMYAALRPGGTAIVVVGAPVRSWRSGHRTERGLEPVRWLLDLTDRVGFTARDVMAFERIGLPGAYAGRFRNDWEPILWLERPGGVATFDKGPLDGPAADPGRRGKASGRRDDGVVVARERSGDAVERGIKRRGTVWPYNVKPGASPGLDDLDHPASFPITLARDAVACFSRVGDLVIDPFCGRGTVGVACRTLGRRHAGGDLGRSSKGVAWASVAQTSWDKSA